MIDESKPIHLSVTEDDIKEGARNSSMFCPIARALQRAIGEEWAEVQTQIIQLPNHRLELSLKAKQFVRRFDSHQPVEPFEEELPPIEQWPKAGDNDYVRLGGMDDDDEDDEDDEDEEDDEWDDEEESDDED